MPAPGQDLVYEALMPISGDTFWVQNLAARVAAAGTVVELNDTAPTTHRWNFAAVEIVPLPRQTPTITWADPAAITYGTPLGASQLDATASVSGSPVAGTFTYAPAPGTVLGAGLNQTLQVTFEPTDQVRYTTAAATAKITVNPAPLKVTAGGGTKAYGATDPTLT